MRFYFALVFLCTTLFANGQGTGGSYSEKFIVAVSNPLNDARENVLVFIPGKEITSGVKKFNMKAFAVYDNGTELASQYNENDPARVGVVFVLDKLGANEKKLIEVRYNPTGTVNHSYIKRTQAELSHKINGEWKNREYVGGEFKNVNYLRVPPEHKDHSWFIRYEGPGWESDKVGYRFYLDQRNAVDVFGKKVPEPVLQKIGQNGFDSYHEMQPWGMDILKVGKSLGLGSIASLVNGSAVRVETTDSLSCKLLENGAVYSSFQTNYSGWKVNNSKHDLQALTSIHAGTLLTHQELKSTGSIDNISSGIGKDGAAQPFSFKGDAKSFGYLATYGKQSLNADEVGLVIFFDPRHFSAFSADEHSHIVKLTPKSGKVDYYFAAAWVLEPDGIKSKSEFEKYVARVSRELANPVRIELKKG